MLVLCAPGDITVAQTKRDAVRHTYLKEIGVREQGGANRGARVETYLKSVNSKAGNPWCVSFVSYCLTQNGVANPRSAWSPAYFASKDVIWQKGKGLNPMAGDVFGIYFKNLGRIGHGGFIDEDVGKYFITVEGNTNQAGSREGDGVYRKRRPKMTIYKVSRFIKD